MQLLYRSAIFLLVFFCFGTVSASQSSNDKIEESTAILSTDLQFVKRSGGVITYEFNNNVHGAYVASFLTLKRRDELIAQAAADLACIDSREFPNSHNRLMYMHQYYTRLPYYSYVESENGSNVPLLVGMRLVADKRWLVTTQQSRGTDNNNNVVISEKILGQSARHDAADIVAIDVTPERTLYVLKQKNAADGGIKRLLCFFPHGSYSSKKLLEPDEWARMVMNGGAVRKKIVPTI